MKCPICGGNGGWDVGVGYRRYQKDITCNGTGRWSLWQWLHYLLFEDRS